MASAGAVGHLIGDVESKAVVSAGVFADTLAIVIAGVWVFAELRALAREIPEDACDDVRS